jgi:hypothetical protein
LSVNAEITALATGPPVVSVTIPEIVAVAGTGSQPHTSLQVVSTILHGSNNATVAANLISRSRQMTACRLDMHRKPEAVKKENCLGELWG